MMFFRILMQVYRELTEHTGLVFLRGLKCYFYSPIFRVNVLAELMRQSRNRLVRQSVRNKLMIRYGMEIGIGAVIGQRLRIEHYNGIVIGGGVVIGDDCRLYHQVTLGQRNGGYPEIGNRVTIYPGAKILGHIHVGDDAVIGANAVVIKDVPENCVVAGVPAGIIKGEAAYDESDKKHNL